MIFVGLLAGVIWATGAAMGTPRRARLIMLALLLVAVMALHLVLPGGHPLREATGGSAALWVMLLAFVALGWGYAQLLGRVKSRAAGQEAAPAAVPDEGRLGEAELDRYARHIVLREIGGPGQMKLRRARVLVVGAGGLGAPAILYLAAAGVGRIGVVDGDEVALANLQRQVIHTEAQAGRPKVYSAADAVAALNSLVDFRPYHRMLTAEIAPELFDDYDLILDGTDSFAARAMVNRAAVAAGKPVIGGALTQWEGQVSVWDPASGGPCYACVFPTAPDPALVPSCAQAGVAGPLPGVIGSMMALEAVKVITGAGEPLRGRLHVHDTLDAEVRVIKLARRGDCEVCG